MNRPKPRDVVRLLMTQKQDIRKDVTTARGNIRENVVHHVFKCPRGDLCKTTGSVSFEKGTGFTNPYKHLKTCLADGDENELIELFHRRRAEKSSFGSVSSANLILSTTTKEQAMYSYLRVIVIKSLPVS